MPQCQHHRILARSLHFQQLAHSKTRKFQPTADSALWSSIGGAAIGYLFIDFHIYVRSPSAMHGHGPVFCLFRDGMGLKCLQVMAEEQVSSLASFVASLDKTPAETMYFSHGNTTHMPSLAVPSQTVHTHLLGLILLYRLHVTHFGMTGTQCAS